MNKLEKYKKRRKWLLIIHTVLLGVLALHLSLSMFNAYQQRPRSIQSTDIGNTSFSIDDTSCGVAFCAQPMALVDNIMFMLFPISTLLVVLLFIPMFIYKIKIRKFQKKNDIQDDINISKLSKSKKIKIAAIVFIVVSALVSLLQVLILFIEDPTNSISNIVYFSSGISLTIGLVLFIIYQIKLLKIN